MIIGLLSILIITLVFPFISKKVEHNLEFFLFFMGLASVIVSNMLTTELIVDILKNPFLYMITGAVLVAGILFKLLKSKVKNVVDLCLRHVSIKTFAFLLIVVLGLMSSVITAIIASLLLVEIITVLPISRQKKIEINIVACFSIGIGAVMTPVGEPIATIVVSKLNVGFWYIFQQLGGLIILGIVIMGLLGAWFIEDRSIKNIFRRSAKDRIEQGIEEVLDGENFNTEEDSYKETVYRTIKIFIFVIALDLLGSGFKPIIDTYVIKLDSSLLYWGNMVSAVLDNATLAAAEISVKMSANQIRAILMGLLISGGMLIPGNIPNIISAGKLKIKSSEWVKLGVPIGLVFLSFYYIILFIV